MNRFFLTLIFAMLTMHAWAQKPSKGDVGFTFGVSGIDNFTIGNVGQTLGFRFIRDNGMVFRLNFNHNTTNVKNVTEVANETTVEIDKTSSSGLSLGLSKSFKGTKRLDPYIGFDLISIYRYKKTNEITLSYPNAADSSITDYQKLLTINNPNMAFGMKPLVGFNYFFTEKLAIGAEFGWGVTYGKAGGGIVKEELSEANVVTIESKNLNNSNTEFILGSQSSSKFSLTVIF